MIIGTGLLAKSFFEYDRDDVVYLCSGVSNSSEINESAFAREAQLVQKFVSSEKKIVYFSSCFTSLPGFNTPYYAHKRRMEECVKGAKQSLIFRLPQVVGRNSNPYTLINSFSNSILKNEKVKILKSKRNLIDVEDVVKVVSYYINNLCTDGPFSRVENVANPLNYDVKDIYIELTTVLKRTENFIELDVHQHVPEIKLSPSILEIYKICKIEFDDQYLRKTLRKHSV